MRGLRSFCALSLALLCCCGGADLVCAESNPTPQKESDTIRGTVLNSVTHQPVGRALVYSPDNHFATLTDSAGHFEFKVPSREPERRSERPELFAGPTATPLAEEISRTIFLEARKPGFLSSQNSYPNTPPTPASPGQKDVTIYLVPAALIAGRVTVVDSDSPERIQVEIYRRQIQNGRAHWTSAGTFTTWSNGEFRFPELSPGAYKLFTHELMDRDPLTFNPRGQLYGYPPVYFPGANIFAAGSTIQLSAGTTFEADLAPSRREYYPVELGIANAPEGAPVGVEISAGGRGGPGYALGYNPQTQKIQGMLPDGSYSVSMSTFGRPPGATGTVDLSVKGAAATGYILTMAPNASISVTVTEEFTSAENRGDVSRPGSFGGNQERRGRYIQVSLEPSEEIGQGQGASLRQPTGPEDESLVLENVRPGRYWVRVDSPRGFAASIKCGETDLLHNPLVVGAGGSSDPIELTMRDDGAQIDGIIENVPAKSGRSLIQAAQMTAHIYFIPSQDGTGQFREVWASPDGNFSLRQIPPGDYQVLAFDRPQPELEYRNEKAMRKYHSQEKSIRLVAGQKEELRLHMILGSDER